MTKTWWQSGTFWGAVATGLTGVGKIVVGVSTGDVEGIGSGVAILVGAWTAWRLRKGQGIEIEQ